MARELTIARSAIALRAAEIALTGGHRLGLLSMGTTPDCADIARDVQAAGGDAIVLLPCPCGAFNASHIECICSPRRARGWLRRPQVKADVLSCDLVVEVELELPRGDAGSESWATIMERVAENRPRAEAALQCNATVDDYAYRLFDAWRTRMRPPSRVQQQVQQVARTIAVMGGEFDTELRARAVTGQDDTRLAIVRAHCIAEAVQYASLPLQREVWR